METLNFLKDNPDLAKQVTLSINAWDLLEFATTLSNAKEVKEDAKEDLLSRQEASALLKVNLTTLWQWAKKDYLTPIKAGGRVLYRKSDIDKLLTKTA